MPPRSNDFQKLILALTQLLGGDAVVEESKMLADLVTGELTEVDVYAEGVLAGHTTRMSIECRDHQRKQGPGWVNEMRSKHEFLPTNLLILVSSSGFTDSALAKAASFGIKTITPTQADSDLAAEVLASLGVTATVWHITRQTSSINSNIPTEWLNSNPRVVVPADGKIQFYKSNYQPLVDNPTFIMHALTAEFLPKGPEAIFSETGDRDIETPVMVLPAFNGQLLHAYWTADGYPPVLLPVSTFVARGRLEVLTKAVTVSPSGEIEYDGNSYLTGTAPMEDGNQARIVIADPDGERRTRADFPVYIPPTDNDES